MAASIAEALREAGFTSSDAMLKEIARDALRLYPTDRRARHLRITNAVRNDPALLWTLFERFREGAVDGLVAAVRSDVMEERRGQVINETRTKLASARGGGSSLADTRSKGAPAAALRITGAEARSAVVRLSMLDQFRINGQPIGDCTPNDVTEWNESQAKHRKRDARFIELLIAGVPADRPIRRYRNAEEADAAYQRALREAGR